MQGRRVWLIRHGQTAWNLERRFLGRTDVPLDDIGRAQARSLATTLGPIPAVWSSPLVRAWETAEALGPPRAHAGLAEMDMGELEGLPGDEFSRRYPHLLTAWRTDPSSVDIPGGESMRQVQDRVRGAWEEILSTTTGDLAVVTHQLALASLLCALTDSPLSMFRRFTHRNTAWTLVRPGRDPPLGPSDQAPHLDATAPSTPR